MFRINFNINQLEGLKGVIKKSDALNIAKENIGVIYRRTKSGFGISQTEDRTTRNLKITKSRLPRLALKTKQFRRKYRGKKGAFFSPDKSNLTLTGQLLDSMRAVRKGFYKSSIEISDRPREKVGKERGILTNVTLLDHLRSRGFRFFGLTETDQNIAVEKYRREINNRLKGFG